MPLSCDCYPGCWADHSQGWATIVPANPEDYAKLALELRGSTRHGSCVYMGDRIRVEDDVLESLLAGEILKTDTVVNVFHRAGPVNQGPSRFTLNVDPPPGSNEQVLAAAKALLQHHTNGLGSSLISLGFELGGIRRVVWLEAGELRMAVA